MMSGLHLEASRHTQPLQAWEPFRKLHNIQKHLTEMQVQVQHVLPYHLDLPLFLGPTTCPQLHGSRELIQSLK